MLSKRVDKPPNDVVSFLQHLTGGQLRKGEAHNDEAVRDHDVHDDAHVHVPHEHALLCHPSLRFSIIADRFSMKEFRFHADNEEAASERWKLPLLFSPNDGPNAGERS